MDTTTNDATTKAPHALISTGTRVAVAAAVATVLALAWTGAGQQSRQAVQMTAAAFDRTYVTLPSVDIVTKREKPANVAAAEVAGFRPTPE